MLRPTNVTDDSVALLVPDTQRRFALACVRHVEHVADGNGNNVLRLCHELAEQFINGDASTGDLSRARMVASDLAAKMSAAYSSRENHHYSFASLSAVRYAALATATALEVILENWKDNAGLITALAANARSAARESAAGSGEGERLWQIRTLSNMWHEDSDDNVVPAIDGADFAARHAALSALPVGSIVTDDDGNRWVRLYRMDDSLAWYALDCGRYVMRSTRVLVRKHARGGGETVHTTTDAELQNDEPVIPMREPREKERAKPGAYSRGRDSRARKTERRYARRRDDRTAMRESRDSE